MYGSGTIYGGSKSDSVFAIDGEKGKEDLVEEVVLFEMMAQAYACLRGYEDRLAGRPPGMGFLVGVRHFNCCRQVSVSEEVMIKVRTTTVVGDFFIAQAEVEVNLEMVAEAELKIWLPPTEGLG